MFIRLVVKIYYSKVSLYAEKIGNFNKYYLDLYDYRPCP